MSYYNRRTKLVATLRSINKTAYRNVEIIIVDDGSSEQLVGIESESIFPTSVIRVDPRFKTWTNPSIPFNIGFRNITGDIVVIQNPECSHVGDVISHVAATVNHSNYLSYACYAINDLALDARIEQAFLEGSFEIGTLGDLKMSPPNWSENWSVNWFNHKQYRPVGYHFLSAITTSNLEALGGFDEVFGNGTGFDDDDLVKRIRLRGLDFVILGHDSPFVIHQWHEHKRHNPDATTLRQYEQNKKLFASTGSENRLSSFRFSKKRFCIPRRMNFFWSGEVMSWLRYMTLYSFRRNNPDWDMYLYTCQQTPHTGYSNGEVSDQPTENNFFPKVRELDVKMVSWKCPTLQGIGPAQKSDICTWDILSSVGGFYSDMDILYIKGMEDVYCTMRECTTAVCFYEGHFSIGFLGSAPQDPLYKSLLVTAKSKVAPNDYQSAGISSFNALAGLPYADIMPSSIDAVQLLRNKFPQLRIFNMPSEWVYPRSLTPDVLLSKTAPPPPPGCIGIHWYGGCIEMSKSSRSMTESNYHMKNDAFASIIKGVLS